MELFQHKKIVYMAFNIKTHICVLEIFKRNMFDLNNTSKPCHPHYKKNYIKDITHKKRLNNSFCLLWSLKHRVVWSTEATPLNSCCTGHYQHVHNSGNTLEKPTFVRRFKKRHCLKSRPEYLEML